VRHARPHHN